MNPLAAIFGILPIPCMVFIGFLILMIVLGFRAAKKNKERIEALRNFARQRGFDFQTQRDPAIAQLFHAVPTFRTGDARCGLNTMRGAARMGGLEFGLILGDYHYETTSTDSKGNTKRSSHYFSYLGVVLPVAWHPLISIRRESFFDRVAATFGADDIDFESSEFSRQFYVKGENKKLAYDLFDPRMMQFFMQSDPPNLMIGRGLLVITRGAGTWNITQFAHQLDWLRRFIEQVPRHLVDHLKQHPPTPDRAALLSHLIAISKRTPPPAFPNIRSPIPPINPPFPQHRSQDLPPNAPPHLPPKSPDDRPN